MNCVSSVKERFLISRVIGNREGGKVWRPGTASKRAPSVAHFFQSSLCPKFSHISVWLMAESCIRARLLMEARGRKFDHLYSTLLLGHRAALRHPLGVGKYNLRPGTQLELAWGSLDLQGSWDHRMGSKALGHPGDTRSRRRAENRAGSSLGPRWKEGSSSWSSRKESLA